MAGKAPEIDFVTPLLRLPFWEAVALMNTLLQAVDIRTIGEVCHEHGIKCDLTFPPELQEAAAQVRLAALTPKDLVSGNQQEADHGR